MLRTLYRSISNGLKRIRWRKETKHMSLYIGMPSTAEAFQPDGKILVVAPHADDELIGCHQLILNHRENVVLFYCAFLGSNQNESNRRTREKEFLDYAHAMDVRYIISSPGNVLNDLRLAINDIKPSYLLLPTIVDWHSEHRLINELCLDLFPSTSSPIKICWYHISIPIPRDFINSFVDMSKEQHNYKWGLMKKCYPSQLHMDIARFRFVEKLHGIEKRYCDSYRVLSVNEWQQSTEFALKMRDDFSVLKSSLGNLTQMYELSNGFYSKISITRA